jgi:peptide-methionine (S)-S-oxide reductase
VTYEQLLEVFWNVHDPTTLNRQGPDSGTQYRSVIFYENEEQKKTAEESKRKEQLKYTKEVVTEISQMKRFYPAEEYHQHYMKKKR